LAAGGLLELADGFGFDLANAFAGNLEDVTDFFEGVAVAVAEAVAELDDFAFAVAQGLEDLVDPTAEHLLAGAGGGAFRRAVGDQIAEVAVFAVADGPIETDRIATHGEDAAGFVDCRAGLAGGFFERRLAAELLEQLPRDVADAAHGFDHVDRNADRA